MSSCGWVSRFWSGWIGWVCNLALTSSQLVIGLYWRRTLVLETCSSHPRQTDGRLNWWECTWRSGHIRRFVTVDGRLPRQPGRQALVNGRWLPSVSILLDLFFLLHSARLIFLFFFLDILRHYGRKSEAISPLFILLLCLSGRSGSATSSKQVLRVSSWERRIFSDAFVCVCVSGWGARRERGDCVLQSSHSNQPNCLIKPYYERVNNRLRWRDGGNGSYPTPKRPTAAFSSFLRFILLLLLISRILFSLLGRPRSLDDGVDPSHALYYSSGRAIANCWLFSLSRGKQQLNTKDSSHAE